jgi:alkanesulfonate monooxygenase SsuD/methylene tetrahydromethanopterin reductase-like flavin-dependent oxidoreductase (luciferase family)
MVVEPTRPGGAVEFGIVYNTGYLGTDPARLIGVAQHAEACGFESFYVPEHITLYPGAMLGPCEIVTRLVVSASAVDLDEQRREIDDFAALHHLS